MRFGRSLGTQLLLLLLTSIGAVLAVYSVVHFRVTRTDLLEFVDGSTARSAELIRHATRDGMLLNRLDRVQETLRDIGAHPEVNALRVYDKDGEICLSADSTEVGAHIAIESDLCEACHRADHTTVVGRLSRSGLVTLEGRPVLRHLGVIENEISCSTTGCHPSPSEKPVLGVLDLEMSISPVERRLRAAAWRSAATTAALFVLVAAVVVVFVRHVVQRPIADLAAVTRRISKGDLTTRIDVHGQNELSALARSFNRMAVDLETARGELAQWSEGLERKVVAKTDELRRAQRQVFQMEKMASLGKLSATVAHELNNPIAAMLTYAKLTQRTLHDQTLGADVREELDGYLDTLQHECRRCGDIVRNLLSFARRNGTEMASLDVDDILDRALTLVHHHFQVQGITLERTRLEGNPEITADPGQLQQALVALLVNAVESMSGPAQDARVITVRAEGDEDEVRIHIGDCGTGIDSASLPHIFEPFFTTKDEVNGVGLGLSVVYGIVRRHQGKVDVDTRVGRGTTFRITLPRRPVPDAGPEAREES